MDNKKEIDIPFGAFDSELYYQEINIPDGFEATIKDNKIILKRKKSKDEKIRKWLIGYFNQYIIDGMPQVFGNGLNVKDVIAWLEKQKDTKVKLIISDEGYNKAHQDGIEAVLTNPHKYGLEKQGEQKSQGKSALEAAKEEKVNNQNCVKPADKVEPKFHKDDWIIHQGTENIYQVVTVIDDQYQLKYGDNYTTQYCEDVDRCARLWDVTKDAKNGDILREDSCTFIIERMKPDKTAIVQCCLFNDGDFGLGSTLIFDVDSTHPATKEQRDLLFQKMKEAGYEWNDDTKQLKKIKQEEDVGLTDFENALFSAFSYAWQEYLSGKEVNVAKWVREHSAELLEVAREQKPAWSEKDENNILLLTSIIEECFKNKEQITLYSDTIWANFTKEEVIDMLKSLKDRV